jgi:hypothetical protein
MTITARAREIIQQTDAMVTQTVRFLNNGNPVKDVPVQYAPGADQAGAVANLTSVVKAALARMAADGTTVAVTPLTLLDLTDPVVTPPPTPPVGFDAWQAANANYQRLKYLNTIAPSVTTQRVTDAKAAADALYLPTFEAFL